MSRADGKTGSFSGSAGELPVEQAQLVDGVCNEFEAKWRAGARPDIGAIVRELPEVLRTAAIKELVALDVFYRRKAGGHPSAS